MKALLLVLEDVLSVDARFKQFRTSLFSFEYDWHDWDQIVSERHLNEGGIGKSMICTTISESVTKEDPRFWVR